MTVTDGDCCLNGTAVSFDSTVSFSVQGMREEEITLVMVTVGAFSYRKEKGEMAINGLLQVLLAVAMDVRIRISFHFTQGCFHLWTGLKKLYTVSTIFCPQRNTERY